MAQLTAKWEQKQTCSQNMLQRRAHIKNLQHQLMQWESAVWTCCVDMSWTRYY